MSKPNSKRNLDMAIRRMGEGDEDYLRNRAVIANAVIGQMLPNAVIKGGSSLKIRFGDASTRATTDLDVARSVGGDEGSGSYSRQTPNSSARRCYNSLMNAASLLWIAEAVGVDELTVKMVYDAAVEAGDYRRACGAVRKIITWDMIYACV